MIFTELRLFKSMLDSDKVGDLSAVRRHTETLIADAFKASKPALIEAPPSSGKTTSTFELAETTPAPVTYLCGRTDLYHEAKDHFEGSSETEPHFKSAEDQAEKEAQSSTKTFAVIPSPHRDCPSFQEGEPGDEEALRQLYSKGYSGRKLHFMNPSSARTPCGEECQYLRKLRGIAADIESIDILIGHHSHSHRDSYITDRIVVLDEFNADAFLSSYPDPDSEPIDDPSEIIPAFLEAVADADSSFPATAFKDLTDIIVKRRDDDDAVSAALEWFKSNGASRADAEEFEFIDHSLFEYDRDHLLAPLLTFGLFCMRRVGPQIEMAPHPESDIRELWEAVGLNPSLRVVRDRNTGQMDMLRPPNLSQARQVIGLDGTPTVPLWNLLLPPSAEFTHRQVLNKSDFMTYLTEGLNMSLIQIGNGMHHYAGGRLSPNDHNRFRAIKALEKNRVSLISTKKALNKYRKYDIISNFVRQINSSQNHTQNLEFEGYKTSNFASVKSSNAFGQDSLGVVMGTPFPGNDVVRRWAGLCGEDVEITGKGADKTFGEFGDRIYEHLTHNQVVQAILRFGRDTTVYEQGGATVYIGTEALPEWFESTNAIDICTNKKELAVLRTLKRADVEASRDSLRYKDVPEFRADISTSNFVDEISDKKVRNTLEDLVGVDIVKVKRNHGRHGADLFGWSHNTPVELVDGKHVILGNGCVYITADEWPTDHQ